MSARKRFILSLVSAGLAAAALEAHSGSGGAAVEASRAPAPDSAEPCSPEVDMAQAIETDPDALRLSFEVDSTFAATLRGAARIDAMDLYQQITTLGKLLLFDKTLSVNRNVACTSCHSPAAGFTGSIETINQTIVAYPGSVRELVSARKPQTYAYAPFAPILHYNAAQDDLFGGNFWDMRATGLRLNDPAAEQAQGPPLNPLEMAFPDAACFVYRVAQGPYRGLFEKVWGPQSFAVPWPRDTEAVCSRPGPPPADQPLPVRLDPVHRGIVLRAYDHAVQAIAAYESSPEVSPFSSKFDYALAHPDNPVLTAEELAGWELFSGKAGCNTCHVDGTDRSKPSAGSAPVQPGDVAGSGPLFTDFSSANLGVPRNLDLRFYCLDRPDARGHVPNPDGLAFVDQGVGGFLRSPGNPNRNWSTMAARFDGRMRVPTVRNVDKRPRPDFVKAYMHNGYFKSLREVVDFYNTRDVLPTCLPGDPREKVSCWPPPEVGVNMDTTIGNLGLSDVEVDQIVAFLKTLTDGWVQVDP